MAEDSLGDGGCRTSANGVGDEGGRTLARGCGRRADAAAVEPYNARSGRGRRRRRHADAVAAAGSGQRNPIMREV